MSYLFFFSHSKKNADQELNKFFNDLVHIIHSSANEFSRDGIGFFDERSIKTGEEWPEKLSEAIRMCHVFVSVYSDPYFGSVWCGREWQLFSMRVDNYIKSNQKRPASIIPVLWRPLRKPLPKCATILQFKEDKFGKNYAKLGLMRIMKSPKYENDYQEFVHEFAEHILNTFDKYQLDALDDCSSFRDTKNAFKESNIPDTNNSCHERDAGPRCANFIYVAAKKSEIGDKKRDCGAYGEKRRDWKPFFPRYQNHIGLIAENETYLCEFSQYRVPEWDESSFLLLIENYKKLNKIVMLIVDAWTLRLETYSKLMKNYDAIHLFNCAVLIPFNYEDIETKEKITELTELLKHTFPVNTINEPEYFCYKIRSVEALKKEINNALLKIRARIQKFGKIHKKPPKGGRGIPTVHAAGD